MPDMEKQEWEADYESQIAGFEQQQADWLHAKLAEAYRNGYNDHARSQQKTIAMYGSTA